MAQAYSAGLTVSESIVLRKERILPLKGDVLVKKGEMVTAEQVIARTLLPGAVVPINLANKLGVTPQMIAPNLLIKPGDYIKKGQVLAETKGFFGLFKSKVISPTDGEVESISKHTGQMLLREPRIPIEVAAFMDGLVVEVLPNEGVIIENKSAYVQGIFGLAGETSGEITMLVNSSHESAKITDLKPEHKGKVLVAGSMIDLDFLKKAVEIGAHGIITGGIDDQDIKILLGHDIGVAITGHEKIGITIVVTEGFGKIDLATRTFNLLKKFNGRKASIHGKTQIRAGVMRPEIIIPLEFDEKELVIKEARMATLEIGSQIRIIRQPNFGKIATITGLPEKLHRVESETKVRILEAKLENGDQVTIPRANVEVIEG